MATTFECPQCGYVLRAGRAACPACGSDAETGWRTSEDVDYLSVEIPDEEGEEGEEGGQDGGPASRNSTARRLGVVLLAVLLLAVSIPFLVRLL